MSGAVRSGKLAGLLPLAVLVLIGCQPAPAYVYGTWDIEEVKSLPADPARAATARYYSALHDTANLTIHDDRLAVLNIYGPKDSVTRVNGGIHREGNNLHITFAGTPYPPLDLVYVDGKLTERPLVPGDPPLVLVKGDRK